MSSAIRSGTIIATSFLACTLAFGTPPAATGQSSGKIYCNGLGYCARVSNSPASMPPTQSSTDPTHFNVLTGEPIH